MSEFFLILLVVLSCPVLAEPIDPTEIRVIDGDTIRVHHKQPNVRLVGFNAPETRRVACEAERELGAKATRRLRDIVQAGNLEFVYVACSCPPGTQETATCNYGRDCGTLKSQGRDVGTILMEERSRRALHLRRNTMPENATPMVPVKEPLRRWRNAPRFWIFVSITGLSFTRLSRWYLWLRRCHRGRSRCPLLWRSLSISSR
jgi:hypothetical protein